MAVRNVIAGFSAWLLVACGCSWPAGSVSSVLDRNEAARHLDEAKAAPMPRISPKTRVAAGRMLERQGDFERAIEQYEQAIATDPLCTAGYNRLAVLYQKLGRRAESEGILKHGVRANPDSALLWNNLGFCHLLEGRLVEAETALRRALAKSPAFRRARMNLGIVLAVQGRLEKSVAEFERAVPSDVAEYNVGIICVDREDYAAAQAAFRRALALNPKCPGAAEQLGRVSAIVRATGGRKPDPNVGAAILEAAEGREPNWSLAEDIPLAGPADDADSDGP